MLIWYCFAFVLITTFIVVMALTRPTATDLKVKKRLINIGFVDPTHQIDESVAEFLKLTSFSRNKWLDGALKKWKVAHKVRLLLLQAQSSLSVTAVLCGTLVCGLASFLAFGYFTDDTNVSIAAGLVCTYIPFLYLAILKSQRLKRFNGALPDALDLIVRALRAGYSISAAIEIVSEESPEPIKSEFREVFAQENFGLPHREALLQLANRVPSQDLQFVITAMLLQKETGGNLIEILERTARVIRERLRIDGEVRIHTAQGRLTGAILTALPIFMFFLIRLANPGYAALLTEDPMGRKLIYAGFSGMLLGGLMIRKIVNVKI